MAGKSSSQERALCKLPVELGPTACGLPNQTYKHLWKDKLSLIRKPAILEDSGLSVPPELPPKILLSPENCKEMGGSDLSSLLRQGNRVTANPHCMQMASSQSSSRLVPLSCSHGLFGRLKFLDGILGGGCSEELCSSMSRHKKKFSKRQRDRLEVIS